jgi:hypothetical protein
VEWGQDFVPKVLAQPPVYEIHYATFLEVADRTNQKGLVQTALLMVRTVNSSVLVDYIVENRLEFKHEKDPDAKSDEILKGWGPRARRLKLIASKKFHNGTVCFDDAATIERYVQK